MQIPNKHDSYANSMNNLSASGWDAGCTDSWMMMMVMPNIPPRTLTQIRPDFDI